MTCDVQCEMTDESHSSVLSSLWSFYIFEPWSLEEFYNTESKKYKPTLRLNILLFLSLLVDPLNNAQFGTAVAVARGLKWFAWLWFWCVDGDHHFWWKSDVHIIVPLGSISDRFTVAKSGLNCSPTVREDCYRCWKPQSAPVPYIHLSTFTGDHF